MRHHRTHSSRIQDTIVIVIEIATEITLFVLLSCLAIGWWPHRLTSWRTTVSQSNVQDSGSPFEISGSVASPGKLAEGQRQHRAYGHSLVPGSIHSLEDLISLRQSDP